MTRKCCILLQSCKQQLFNRCNDRIKRFKLQLFCILAGIVGFFLLYECIMHFSTDRLINLLQFLYSILYIYLVIGIIYVIVGYTATLYHHSMIALCLQVYHVEHQQKEINNLIRARVCKSVIPLNSEKLLMNSQLLLLSFS